MALGYANPDTMKSEMGASTMLLWRKFYEDEPFGFEVEWLKAAMIAATVAGSAPRKQGSRSPKISDFMPKKREAPKTADELKAVWRGLVANQG